MTSRGRPAPTTSSGPRASSTRGCRRSRCGCCCSPSTRRRRDRHFDATRATLKYYGEWFGAYPYGHITIVDPAYQSGAGGMEYPTLFTAGTRWLAPAGVTTPESVTVHEAGHQFWYGIVGSNEFEDAWMDEGFNTFSTARAVAQVYDAELPRAALFRRLRAVGGSRHRAQPRDRWQSPGRLPRATPKSDAQSTPSFRYFPVDRRQRITYNKTALWLNTMERWLGWPVLQRIMSTYFAASAVQASRTRAISSPRVNDVAGQDLGWFFDQVYRSSNVFDYGVQDHQERARRRSVPHLGRRPPLRRGDFSGRRAGHLRERRARDRALGRQRSLEGVRLRPAWPGSSRRRSIRTACCCSTSTAPTTRERWSREAARPRPNGR